MVSLTLLSSCCSRCLIRESRWLLMVISTVLVLVLAMLVVVVVVAAAREKFAVVAWRPT